MRIHADPDPQPWFWSNLTKKDRVESAKYDNFSSLTYSFWTFFRGSGFFGRSGLGLRKRKSDPDPDKRTRIRNTAYGT